MLAGVNVKFIITILLTIYSSAALAAFGIFQTYAVAVSSSLGWQALPIGAGGKVTSIDIASDGTKVIRTDTYGGYYFASSPTCGNTPLNGCWQQLLTLQSMSSADLTLGGGVGGGVGAASQNDGGYIEVVVAPSNTNRAYSFFYGYVYRTDNLKSGASISWTRTAYARTLSGGNPPGPNTALNGLRKFMAVDPANADVIYASSIFLELRVSTDAGATWSTAPTVANAGSNFGQIIAFDPSSAVSGGKTQGIYACSYGTGCYRSTNGGAGFSLLNSAGMPTTAICLVVAPSGLVWTVDTSGVVKTYNGTSWTTISSGTYQGPLNYGGQTPSAVAVDPANSNHVVIMSGAAITVSGNAGTSWSGWQLIPPGTGFIPSATDVPWLAVTGDSFPVIGNIQFDPSQTNVMYYTNGIGVWWTKPQSAPVTSSTSLSCSTGSKTFTTSSNESANLILGQTIQLYDTGTNLAMTGTLTNISGTSLTANITSNGCGVTSSTWSVVIVPSMRSQSAGIEQMVGTKMVISPAGYTNAFFWDRPQFLSTSLTTYPSTQGPNNNVNQDIVGGWDGDWCSSSTSRIVVLATSNTAATDNSGYSTDGGATWSAFSGTFPDITYGGAIACSSTTTLIRVAGGLSSEVYRTGDNGGTWTKSVFPAGVPTSGQVGWNNGFGGAGQRHSLAADRVTANKFYAYNSSTAGIGLYVSTDGGQNFSLTFSGSISGISSSADQNGNLKAVPGNAGHLFWNSVVSGGTAGNIWKYSTNSGATWNVVDSGFTVVAAYGFGAIYSGQSYPSLLAIGIRSGTYSIYECRNFNPATGTGTWTDVANVNPSLPYYTGDAPIDVDGDKITSGLWYITQQGSSVIYGRVN